MTSCLAQQQVMRAQMTALEARVERLEALLAAISPTQINEANVRASSSSVTRGQNSPSPVPAQSQASAADGASPFGAAIRRLNEKSAIQGADEVLELVRQHPEHPEAPHALLLSAETLLSAQELVLADWTFEKVIHDWPESPEALTALWRRAEIAGRRGRPDEAKGHLKALAGRRDGGALAVQAQEALEKIDQKKDSGEKLH